MLSVVQALRSPHQLTHVQSVYNALHFPMYLALRICYILLSLLGRESFCRMALQETRNPPPLRLEIYHFFSECRHNNMKFPSAVTKSVIVIVIVKRV
jgi:hypothetical protein